MLGSKYIFETKETRTIRYIRNGFLVLFSILFIYLLSGYFFILFSDNETKKSGTIFYQSAPDLIVIFTGDQGRIPFGIKLAKSYSQSNIFITGVHGKNSVQTLLNPLEIDGKIDTNLLEIDYFARNTVENCLSTLRYLREKKGFKKILVVSHDYHIPRIRAIFSRTTTEEDQYEFYFMGVTTDYSNYRNLKVLYTEVYKYIRTYAFLMIWDNDSDGLIL